MRRQNILLMAIFLIVSAVLSLPVAAQAPRAAPSNDDFINRKTIVPGKSYSETSIHEATVQVNQPTPSCGAVYFSVWYTFTVSQSTRIYLSTGGSLLKGALEDSIDTVIAVYTGNDLLTLSPTACNDDGDSPYAELTINVAAGVAYAVMVGVATDDILIGGSRLVLDTRVTGTGWQPLNHEFELPLTSADWKVKNPTGDGRVCSTPATPAFTGSCAFAFVGNPGEASGLKLTMPVPTYFAPRRNGTLLMQGYIRVLNAPLGSAKIKFKVTYTDGTLPSVATVNLNGAGVVANYTKINRSILLPSKAVDKVQIQAVFNSTTGTLMLDLFALGYQAAVISRDAPVLPAPLAAPLKR